jgi:lipopolysaccharide export system permease protein
LLSYYALLSLGKALGEKGLLRPLPALWLPNVAIGAVASYFFRKALNESPLALPPMLEQRLLQVRQNLRKLHSRKKPWQ